MAYIKSKDIQLFPSAFRGQQEGVGTVYNPGSRLTTEYNLTSLASRMSSVHKSYVIEYNDSDNDSASSKDILFSLNGYLFAIKMNGGDINYFDEFADSNEIWAKIKLVPISDNPDTNNTIETKPVLRPLSEDSLGLLDIDDEFVGLELTSTKPDVSQFKVLKLFEKQNDTWFVPKSSYFRIYSEEVESNLTDGLSINDEFDVARLTADKINNVRITTASDSATLTIHDGKTLTAENSIKLAGTDNAVLTLNKNLTVAGTHNITLETSGADRTLTLTGSPSLSGITTTGTGTLALGNKTLTANSSITLAGTDNKTLTVNDNMTVGTNAITLQSGKSLTMQHAGLTVGDSSGTGHITLKSNNSADRVLTLSGSPTLIGNNSLTLTHASLVVGDSSGTGTVTIKTSDATGRNLTLTGSPSLSAITTTGSGTLALNKNLTINGADKTLAGAGTTLTINNDLDIAGTTGQITLGTGNHTLAFETTGNTEVTLPTTGTLATIDGLESLTNKTINGLSLTSETHGFKISGGTTPKTLTIADTVTIDAEVTVVEPVNIQSSLYVDSETIIQSGVNIQGALTISNTTSVGADFTVGGGTGKTGAVKVYSAGTSPTEIIGPNNGTATLVSGTYTSSATTANSESATGGTLVKRTSAGNISANNISANRVYASSVSASSFNGNATSATNTAFTNAKWASPAIAIDGTLPSSVLNKTLEIGVMYTDYQGPQSMYYNFGIITLHSLLGSDSEWYVGTIYAGGETYSLTITSNRAVYFNQGTTRITDGKYKLHYRIIT